MNLSPPQFYLIARHPEGKWEKTSGPYPTQNEVLLIKEGMEKGYFILTGGTFCPEFEIYITQNSGKLINDDKTTSFHGGSVN